jgi:hypothetical protein
MLTVAGLLAGAGALLARHPAPPGPAPRLPENTATGGGGGAGGRYGSGSNGLGRKPSAVRLLPEGVRALGTLAPTQVFYVIHRNRQQLRFCYENARLHAPSLAGQVEAHLLIGADGRVKASEIESTTGNADLEHCLIERFRSWDWPKAVEGGTTEVRFLFELSPDPE